MYQSIICTTLTVIVLMASQHQPSSTEAKSLSISESEHYQAKMLHEKHRQQAEAAASAASGPNMWAILGQSKNDGKRPYSQPHNTSNDAALEQKHHNKQHHSKHSSKHHHPHHQHQHQNDAEQSSAEQPAEQAVKNVVGCPKCQQKDGHIMTEEELTELRIEYVKNQILKKLKLSKRPDVLPGAVPRPIAEGATLQPDDQDDDNDVDSVADDFYAKTNQKIIFPQLDADNCHDSMAIGSSMCFRFTIPSDIERQAIESAELWVYKQPHISDSNVNFVINEVETWMNNRVIKPIAIQETNNTEVWVKINIAGKMKSWIEHDDLTHVIDISCATCDPHPYLDLLRLDNDYRPFIVVNTYSNSRPSKRLKRNLNCSAGVTSCCRDHLYISFADIGWNDWMLHPPGYDAYFCRGSCASAASITQSSSNYNSVLRKFSYTHRSMELASCCTAKKFSSLTLFYTDSNNTATQKTLPNMVVEACGCS